MENRLLDEVFTAGEVSRAAGVPAQAVTTLISSGLVRTLPVGGRLTYLDWHEALRAGRLLASGLPAAGSPVFEPAAPRPLFEPVAATTRPPAAFAISSAAHAVVIAGLAFATVGIGAAAPDAATTLRSDTRLVYVTVAGPGGGGGGGGARRPEPPRPARRRGDRPLSSPVPALPRPEPPVQTASAPPPQVIEAPVAPVPADDVEQTGALDEVPEAVAGGPGEDGNAGAGAEGGIGDGAGDGLGEGEDGGTGGGPYRPGAGIEPPTVLREVKPLYTESARRLGLQGEVLLEIVVRRDGSVGDVRILRGLGQGLDERAVDAVGQWRFAPATRYGTAVDVLVEVAMEFRLR